MKSLLVLLAAAMAPLLGRAQAVAPTPAPPPAAASAAPGPGGSAHDAAATVPLPGQPSGPTLEKNMPLIPETAPSRSRSSSHSHGAHASASPHLAATFQTEQDIRTRVRMRKANTVASNEPVVQADWDAAQSARADTDFRALMKVYYNHLFDEMIKVDPSLAMHINVRRQAAIDRLRYTRLGDQPEAGTDDPFVAPLQAPSGPNPPVSENSASQ